MADADGSASELGSLGAAALVSAAEGAWHADRSGRVRCTGDGGVNGCARIRAAGAGWALGGVGDEPVGESAAELVRVYDHLSRGAKSENSVVGCGAGWDAGGGVVGVGAAGAHGLFPAPELSERVWDNWVVYCSDVV